MAIGRSTSPSHRVGSIAEDNAVKILQKAGFDIVAQNWHKTQIGEIDIIATKETTLIFVEVKLRKSDAYGSAVEQVTYSKQKKIIQAAQYFLAENEHFYTYDCRFDVITFQGKNVAFDWIENAFSL